MAWETKKLGDICEITIGKTPSRSDLSLWDTNRKNKNIWLSIADLPISIKPIILDSKEYISNKGANICKLVPKGALIVSFKLSLGILAITGCDLYTNEAIAALYINNKNQISRDYLYWFLTFFDWDKEARGDIKVKGKTLNKQKLKEISMIFPGIKEQKRIVAILDQAFADIEKIRANTEKNLKNARKLFESYLQQVFATNQASWGKSELSQHVKFIDYRGKTPPKTDSGIRLITAKNVRM